MINIFLLINYFLIIHLIGEYFGRKINLIGK